jgi:hypothetical protein
VAERLAAAVAADRILQAEDFSAVLQMLFYRPAA